MACGSPAPFVCPNDLPASCPNPAPSWSTQVQPIVNADCVGPCHNPTGANPTVNLSDYADVDARKGIILSDVYACKMPPPDGGVTVSESDRQAILGWLVCGAPDN